MTTGMAGIGNYTPMLSIDNWSTIVDCYQTLGCIAPRVTSAFDVWSNLVERFETSALKGMHVVPLSNCVDDVGREREIT